MSKNTNLSFLTDYITADITNGRIGINNASPAYSFDVTGIARTSTSTYLATASGNVGIGTTSPDQLLSVRKTSAGAETIALALQNIGGTANTAVAMVFCPHENSATPEPLAKISAIRTATSGAPTDIAFYTYNTGLSEKMRITATGNVGIGTSSPSYKLQVNGNGYFGSGLTVEGTAYATSLVLTAAINTYNVTQFYYGQNFTFTVPNALNSGSDNSAMRMYMVWVWGANGVTEAGCKVWMVAMNGGGTAYTANEILGRDANGGTGLAIARTSASQLTISSNNNAFIKFVSIMQLNTNT